MCSAVNWVCRPAGTGAHMYKPSHVQAVTYTGSYMHTPAHARPSAADLVRRLYLLAKGRARLARRLAAQAKC